MHQPALESWFRGRELAFLVSHTDSNMGGQSLGFVSKTSSPEKHQDETSSPEKHQDGVSPSCILKCVSIRVGGECSCLAFQGISSCVLDLGWLLSTCLSHHDLSGHFDPDLTGTCSGLG